MSSHLMIVQGPNLTENYQSTNQDKNFKILSWNYVDSDNKWYVMSWIADLVPELFISQTSPKRIIGEKKYIYIE